MTLLDKSSYMKKIVFFLISFGCYCAFAQNMDVNDLFIIQQNKDINQINYFLVKYKSFTYVGHLGVNEDGWDDYKFAKDGDEIIVGTASGMVEGKFLELTSVEYILYNSQQYLQFINSLVKNKYKKGEQKYSNDGIPFVMWNGTRNLKEALNSVTIFEEKNRHRITIL